MPLCLDKFENSCYYHVFNRGNNGGTIFFQKRNYFYFMKKLDQYLEDHINLYSYCLLPNHFHLLLSPRDDAFHDHNGITEQFRRFFISYSQAINKQEGRTGSLFEKPYHRKKVDGDTYLTQLIRYIHYNPARHGVKADWQRYPWSSYRALTTDSKLSRINKEPVWDWFGSREQFIADHAFMEEHFAHK